MDEFRPTILRRRVFWIAVILLVIHAALLAWGAYIHSPTLNEPGHLVAGISNWQFGRFGVYKVNPPLVRMVAALPVMAAGAKTDWSKFYDAPGARPEFSLGEDFVAANRERSMWLVTIARWACIPFSLLGGFLCYRWARELYGILAGLLALTLWCFCPNIFTHGQLITSDVAATSLGLAACYTFWHWLRQPTWGRTLISGLALSAAELAKMTLIVFVPLWFTMWLAYRLADRHHTAWTGWLREFGMLAARMLLALYILNFGYSFEGTFTRLGDFKFVSVSLGAEGKADKAPAGGGNRFAGTWFGSLPVPLPKNYVLGIDLQRSDFENYGHPSYLRGEFRNHGWWYYYLYALAIKVPLGTWVLVFLAATRRIWLGKVQGAGFRDQESNDTGHELAVKSQKSEQPLNGRAGTVAAMIGPPLSPSPAGDGKGEGVRFRDEFVLLCPAVVIFVFVSSQTGFSEHMRDVLPAFPFVFVWIGRIAPRSRHNPCVESQINAPPQEIQATPNVPRPQRITGRRAQRSPVA